MRVGDWFVLWLWVRVVFGMGYLRRLVVVEVKQLFAVYVNVWHVIEHDRFHRHAFSAVSIGLRGRYQEEVLLEDGTRRIDTYAAPWVRWIPRTHNHRMLRSKPGTISVTLAGPWDRMWTETYLNGAVRVLTWGRKVVAHGEGRR